MYARKRPLQFCVYSVLGTIVVINVWVGGLCGAKPPSDSQSIIFARISWSEFFFQVCRPALFMRQSAHPTSWVLCKQIRILAEDEKQNIREH